MGQLYCNVAFNPEIGSLMAHQMIKAAERMTYRQFCLLKIFGDGTIRNTLCATNYRNQGNFPIDLRQVLYECFDLAKGYYIAEESYILGVTDLCPRNTRAQGLGADLLNVLELRTIRKDDLVPIVRLLK